MKGRKTLRRTGVALAFGALLCAGVMASGALGMVSAVSGSSDSSSTAADTTTSATDSSSTDTSATATDTTQTSTDATTSTESTTNGSTTTTTGSSSTFVPSIKSDQEDYNPGATVILTGTGWGPGESVHIVVNDDKSQPWSYATDSAADLAGAFTIQFQLPTSFAAAYSVRATGASGAVATTGFTDGNVNVKTAGVASASVDWRLFTNTTCTGSGTSSGNISATSGGNGTGIPGGVDAGQALRLTANAVTGASFSSWSNGNFVGGDPNTANPVCLLGGTNTQNITLTYSTVQNQTITVTTHAPSSAVFNSSFVVAATASSGLAVTYSSAGSCSNTGAIFTMTSGTGTCTVKYDQAGSSGFNPAPQVTESVAAAKASQTITFAALGNKTYGDADFNVSATASSGLSVSFAASGNCTVTGTTVHITGAGSCTITASQGGNGNYNAAADVPRTFTIGKAASATTVTCGGGPFTYDGSAQTPCSGVATGPGGLNQSLTVSYTNNVNAGTATASASFAATANYLASSDSKNFTIGKAGQTITFGALGNKIFGDADFMVSATSDSGLAVSFSPLGNCDVSLGGMVHLQGAGSCTITASQDGNANYEPASSVPQAFTIAKATSVTTVTCGAGPFTYTGSAQTPCSASVTGPGRLSLLLTVDYSNNVDAGTATGSASYAESDNYLGSSDSKDFTIDKAPSHTVVTCPGSVTYDGSAQTPCSAHVAGAGGLNLTPTPSYSNNVGAGTATASYTYGGDANHTSSSDSKNFTIDKASSTTVVTCPASVTYNGSPQAPCSVAVTGAGSLSLVPDPVYSNNTNAGTATASYSYAGDANHDGSSDSKDFTIDRASSHTVVTCPGSVTYDGSAQMPCSVAVSGAGGLSLTPAAAYSHNTNAGTASASYSYAGDANHGGSSDSKDFTINKRNVTGSIAAADKTYDSTDAATISSCSLEAQSGGHGVVSPDAVGCAGSNGHFGSPSAANGKQVTANVALTGTAQGNYQLTSPTASTTANISKRDVTASISATGKVYDGTDTATISTCSLDAQSGDHGAIASDTVGCSGSNGHFNNKNAANGKPVTSDVALTGTAAGNYNLTSTSAATTANITKAPLALKAADKTMLINGPVPTLTYTFSGFVGGETLATSDVSGSAACSTASGAVAGQFPITCTTGSLSSGNYNFSFSSGTLTVNYAVSCLGAPIGNPILQPVNNDGSSTFKQGSTIPLKFRACDANGASVGPTTAVPNIVASFVLDHTTTGTPGVNETVDSTTPDTAFRWSSTDQQWIFNLSTKNLTNNKTYYYKVTLVGGASFMITFGLK